MADDDSRVRGLARRCRLLTALLVASMVINAAGAGYAVYRLAKRNAPKPDHYTAHRDHLFGTLPAPEGSIMMLGASLNDWAEWHEILGDARVINRGIRGSTSGQVLERLQNVIVGSPAKIALMVGLNDLDQGGVIDTVIDNHRVLLGWLGENRPGTELILQSILPVNPSFYTGPATNESIASLNRQLESLCRDFSTCQYLDVGALLVDERGRLDARYTYDGVHLNGDGYQVWKNALAPLLAD